MSDTESVSSVDSRVSSLNQRDVYLTAKEAHTQVCVFKQSIITSQHST